MSSSLSFLPSSDSLSTLPSLDECNRHLSQPELDNAEKAHWLCLKGKRFIKDGQQVRALSCFNDVLQYDPESIQAIAHRALANEHLGYYDVALIDYDLALSNLPAVTTETGQPQPPHPSQINHHQALWLWQRKGHIYRSLKQYDEALSSYNAALSLDPNAAEALSGRGTVQVLKGKRKNGLQDCQRAVQLAPTSVVSLNSLGIVLLFIRQYKDALRQFDQALDHQPDFCKAWINRAIALSRMGRDPEALESLEKGLAMSHDTHEAWYPSAWALMGITQIKLGQFSDAITSCEKAQSIDPTLYRAALGKVISLIASGRIMKRLLKRESRHQLGHDVFTIVNALKFRFLVLAAIIGIILLSNHSILVGLRSLFPTFLSLGIIGLIAADLWLNKSKIQFVWTVYFQSGVLTYIRAIGILTATLTTFAIAEHITPPFMSWGWANAVFGQPGNIIFQPFNLLNTLPSAEIYHATLTAAEALLGIVHPIGVLIFQTYSRVTLGTIAHATFQLNLGSVFIVFFWIMLILGIPFWARLEERIFRQGAHSWRQICIRSTQFGLVHLLVGIPILAGFVLIVPGFLFACRYKYVYEKSLKAYLSPLQAQEAGLLASTADHAVYNAILVTFVASMLFVQQSIQ